VNYRQYNVMPLVRPSFSFLFLMILPSKGIIA
jgi:hypothetical protein